MVSHFDREKSAFSGRQAHAISPARFARLIEDMPKKPRDGETEDQIKALGVLQRVATGMHWQEIPTHMISPNLEPILALDQPSGYQRLGMMAARAFEQASEVNHRYSLGKKSRKTLKQLTIDIEEACLGFKKIVKDKEPFDLIEKIQWNSSEYFDGLRLEHKSKVEEFFRHMKKMKDRCDAIANSGIALGDRNISSPGNAVPLGLRFLEQRLAEVWMLTTGTEIPKRGRKDQVGAGSIPEHCDFPSYLESVLRITLLTPSWHVNAVDGALKRLSNWDGLPFRPDRIWNARINPMCLGDLQSEGLAIDVGPYNTFNREVDGVD